MIKFFISKINRKNMKPKALNKFTIPEDLNTIIKELSKEVNRENTQNIKVINIMSSVTCSYSYSNIFYYHIFITICFF